MDNTQDIINVSDLTDRLEELEEERDAYEPEGMQDERWEVTFPEQAEELTALIELLSDLKGYGGDHQWRGDWYPAALIQASYFQTYAQELAEDIGAINHNASWPNDCIDWERAARELQMDYSECDVDGVMYWYR